MKNFRDSDYAVNKYSKGIVYRFANEIVEVTLEEYLAANPEKTEKDFQVLKGISNEMYLGQDRNENTQTYRNDPIHDMENFIDPDEVAPDEDYIELYDRKRAWQAFNQLLESEKLTKIQKRRFLMHITEGLSTRQIAEKEGVTQRAVIKSLYASYEKIKIFFC